MNFFWLAPRKILYAEGQLCHWIFVHNEDISHQTRLQLASSLLPLLGPKAHFYSAWAHFWKLKIKLSIWESFDSSVELLFFSPPTILSSLTSSVDYRLAYAIVHWTPFFFSEILSGNWLHAWRYYQGWTFYRILCMASTMKDHTQPHQPELDFVYWLT